MASTHVYFEINITSSEGVVSFQGSQLNMNRNIKIEIGLIDGSHPYIVLIVVS